jgi:hypothetical protein
MATDLADFYEHAQWVLEEVAPRGKCTRIAWVGGAEMRSTPDQDIEIQMADPPFRQLKSGIRAQYAAMETTQYANSRTDYGFNYCSVLMDLFGLVRSI